MTAPLQPRGWYPDLSAAPGKPLPALQPKDDPFYSYTGNTPLADIPPGTVLETRNIHYHILGVPTSLKTIQLLYRSTSQTGNPTVNVTSVIQPLSQPDKTKLISYQSAYDSLNRNDEPSGRVRCSPTGRRGTASACGNRPRESVAVHRRSARVLR